MIEHYTHYLNLGTNLGDRHANLAAAVAALRQLGACRTSGTIESEPWGFDSDNAFVNQAVELRCAIAPQELLAHTQRIERQLGSASHRDTQGRYQDRLIDIDIMLSLDPHGQPVAMSSPTLTLPHQHLRQRSFFTIPLGELLPGWQQLLER